MLSPRNEAEIGKSSKAVHEFELNTGKGYETPRLVQVGTLDSIQGSSGRKGDHDVGSSYAWY